MKVQTQDYNEVTVIELLGDLESEFCELLKRTVSDIITRGQSGLVLDMNDVSFIDSEGLEVLLWTGDYCRDNKCELRLAGLDENCQTILSITRISDEFDRYPELSEAVRSFA
jgi:anti-sigma B factor antagonist